MDYRKKFVVEPDAKGGRLARPSSLSIGARAEPATSIISRATRSGRRHFVLAECGSGRTMELGRSGERSIIIMRPPRRRASELRGHRQRAALKDQQCILRRASQRTKIGFNTY